MKRIIALILAVFCLSSICVFAETAENVARVNENFSTLTLNGERYETFDSATLRTSEFSELKCTFDLTDTQKETVERIYTQTNEKGNIITAEYTFKNGSVLNAYYLHEDFLEEYNTVKSDDWNLCEIDFIYPENNTLSISKDKLFGESYNLFTAEVDIDNWFDVDAVSSDKSFGVTKGILIDTDEEYYYLDFNTAGITYSDFDIENYDHLPVYKITDPQFKEQIDKAIDEFYDYDYGFLTDDKTTQKISDIVLVIIFLILPFAVFVLFFVLALRSKTKYRKFFRTIYILALILTLVFVILAIIL